MKTFLRRPGNKTRYVKYITAHVPREYNTYIEPFLGSGAMFLHLQPKKWIVNDVDRDIMSAWENVWENDGVIAQILKRYGKRLVAHKERHHATLECRRLLKEMTGMKYDATRSALFMLLSYSVYGGILIRYHKYYFRGLEAKHYGVGGKIPYCFKSEYHANLRAVHEFLNGTRGKMHHMDYKNVLKKAKKGDFVFLDPPYVEDEKDYNFQYNSGEQLGTGFLQELRSEVDKLDERGVRFLMTQANTPEVRQMFKGYNINPYRVYRRHQDVQHTTEVAISNSVGSRHS
jgi:DNA adenine methylase